MTSPLVSDNLNIGQRRACLRRWRTSKARKAKNMADPKSWLHDALEELSNDGFDSLSLEQRELLIDLMSTTELSGRLIADVVSGQFYRKGDTQ
jgi:hypothetical protein